MASTSIAIRCARGCPTSAASTPRRRTWRAFPIFCNARPIRLILEPGDALYLPRLWWHQMRSLDFSISVSHWWASGAAFWAVRAALLYKKLRALRY
jgi:Cupin-like domain